jgi:DNA-binding transcriptional ArsR family regulator
LTEVRAATTEFGVRGARPQGPALVSTNRTRELPPAPNVSLLAEVGSLVGDPARTNMLISLRNAGEMSSSQLAVAAGVAPQTASGHLAKLTAAGLVKVEKRGRYHLYRLGSSHVTDLLEAIHVAGVHLNMGRPRSDEVPPALVRRCRGHMAGPLAVALACSVLDLHPALGPVLDARGLEALSRWGLSGRKASWTPCLDHSEGRDHIGGSLGADILEYSLALGWVRRVKRDDLVVTLSGWRGFKNRFDIDLHTAGATSSPTAMAEPRRKTGEQL